MVTAGFFPLTLVDRVHEYDQVFTFKFAPDASVPFIPGQYAHLLAPNSPPGRENVRHFSIASTPSEGPLWFSMDLSSGSDYKNKFAELEVGGKAHLFKVKGEFVLEPEPSGTVFFLAGGIGITPIRPLLLSLVGNAQVEWRLAHVARSGHLYEKELRSLGGIQARVRPSELGALLADWTRECPAARWFVSGSSRFVTGMTESLQAQGVSTANLRVENFE